MAKKKNDTLLDVEPYISEYASLYFMFLTSFFQNYIKFSIFSISD